jgi:hypothetical protein
MSTARSHGLRLIEGEPALSRLTNKRPVPKVTAIFVGGRAGEILPGDKKRRTCEIEAGLERVYVADLDGKLVTPPDDLAAPGACEVLNKAQWLWELYELVQAPQSADPEHPEDPAEQQVATPMQPPEHHEEGAPLVYICTRPLRMKDASFIGRETFPMFDPPTTSECLPVVGESVQVAEAGILL